MDKPYLDYAMEQLAALVAIPSPSGFTDQAARYCADVFTSLGYTPQITHKGGVLVCLGGCAEEGALLLGAHIDTLGGMVREIKANGQLRIAPIGGLQANNVETETVTVYARGGGVYEGTMQLDDASVHVNGEYAKTARTFDTLELLLDEKTHTKEETQALGIEVGDYVAVNPRYTVTASGYIKSRFLDDKLSVAILLAYAKYLRDTGKTPKRRVYIYFTVFEEIGHGGAASIPADVTEMISVDMGCVGKGLACDETMASICVLNSRGPSHKTVVDALVRAAQTAGVRYALDVYPHYSSDVDVSLMAGYDIRHCVMGAGVYASHGYERSHVEGLANTFDLLCAYIGTKI